MLETSKWTLFLQEGLETSKWGRTFQETFSVGLGRLLVSCESVSYTHLPLPTNREV